MYQEEVEVNRWQQSYLHTPLCIPKHRSYMYSSFDTSSNTISLPSSFQPYYDYIVNQDDQYNQVVANWYQDENDYISPHSDCELGMIPDAEIAIISLYESPYDHRVLNIIPKNKEKGFNIPLKHGLIVTMCGNTQKEFKHGIKKSEKTVPRRISLSFRQFTT